MRFTEKITSHRLLATGVALLWPLMAAAAPPPGPAADCTRDFHSTPPPHSAGPPGPPGPHGRPDELLDDARPPPFLTDLTLTDEQQDKVFSIMHAAAPALRDQSKAARKARQSLHELVKSAQFNESTAASLAQTQARAESQLVLLRTRAEHEVYGVLTSEQTARISAHESEWQRYGSGGPPPL